MELSSAKIGTQGNIKKENKLTYSTFRITPLFVNFSFLSFSFFSFWYRGDMLIVLEFSMCPSIIIYSWTEFYASQGHYFIHHFVKFTLHTNHSSFPSLLSSSFPLCSLLPSILPSTPPLSPFKWSKATPGNQQSIVYIKLRWDQVPSQCFKAEQVSTIGNRLQRARSCIRVRSWSCC